MTGYPRKPDEPARARKNWTVEELQYLSDKYGLVSKKTLARNLQRTPGAVYLTTKKLLHHQRIGDNFYTAQELARILGVRCAKTVAFWAHQGWLKGRRAQYKQGMNRFWIFTEKNIVRFLKERPWIVNLNNMPEHYLRSIVKKEWERDPWYRPYQVAPMLGVKTLDAIHRYIYLGWLPANKKPGGPWQGIWIIRRSTVEAFMANDPRPGHRWKLSSAARKRTLIEKGRPIKVGMVWQFQCPRCGLQVKIMAPPRMVGPYVRERFMNIYMNGACSHGSVCRIREELHKRKEAN